MEERALIEASSEGHAAIVKLLLQARADKGLKNNSLQSALFVATNNRRAVVVELLLEAGAKNCDDLDDVCYVRRTVHKKGMSNEDKA